MPILFFRVTNTQINDIEFDEILTIYLQILYVILLRAYKKCVIIKIVSGLSALF